MESEYSKKLRDPRWQKLRLQILERDDWACRNCEARDRTLHVHHRAYEWGRDPWEYEANALLTLCETCHAEESEGQKSSDAALVWAFRVDAGLTNYGIDSLCGSLFCLPQSACREWGPQLLDAINVLCRLAHAPDGLKRAVPTLAQLTAEIEGVDPKLQTNMQSLFGKLPGEQA